MSEILKECLSCRALLPLEQFSRHKGKPYGRQARCKPCHRAQVRASYRDDPQKLKRRARKSALQTRYRLTIEQYNAMLARQCGLCAICKRPGAGATLCVDHDHACCPDQKKTCGGCIRGLLCQACNTGLGRFRDDAQVLSAAVRYLAAY